MNKEKLIFYSLLSGEIYEVEEDEADNLDQFQISILKKPKDSCKKCYGRGYIGFDINKKYYPMCRCIIKHINKERIKDINLKY